MFDKTKTCLGQRWVQKHVLPILGPGGEENRREERVLLPFWGHVRPQERLKLLNRSSVYPRGEPDLFEPRAKYHGSTAPKAVDMKRAAACHGASYLRVVWVICQCREKKEKFKVTYERLASS